MLFRSTIGSRELFCTADPARREKGCPLLSCPRYSASVTRMRSLATSTLFLSRTKLTLSPLVKGAVAKSALSTPTATGSQFLSRPTSRSWLPPGRAQWRRTSRC